MAAAAMLEKFQMAISPQPVVQSTSCFVLEWGYLMALFSIQQIQDGGSRHIG